MPATLNKVMLIGNLTRDPEMRSLPSGQSVTTFSIALNRTYQTPQGEKKDEVTFVKIVTWAKLAEICNQYLKKGSSVFVEGRLQVRSWDAQDGTKRSSTEVVAGSVQFLTSKSGTRSSSSDVPGAPEEDTVIDDSFGGGAPQGGIKISQNELAPDEEVPF